MSRKIRLKYLATYLQLLAADVAERGGFASTGTDPVEAAAKAALSGAGALLNTLWEDVKVLAGLGAKATIDAARPLAARVAGEAVERGVGALFNKLFRNRT